MRNQPRTGKARIPHSAGFIAAIDRAVEREAQRFNVSRSFVIATAVAMTLGIGEDEQPDYAVSKRKLKLVHSERRKANG